MNEIIICIYSFDLGGAEKVAVSLINSFVAIGFRVKIFCLKKQGILIEQLNVSTEEIFEIGGTISIKGITNAARKLRSKIALGSTVLCIGELPNIIGCILNSQYNVTISEHSINTFVNTAGLYGGSLFFYAYTKFKYKNAKKVISVSNAVFDRVKKYTPRAMHKVIFNPVDAEQIQSLSRECLPPNEELLFLKKSVIVVARLHASKNHRLAIEAFNILSQENDFNLVFIGDGPERPKLEKYIQELKLDSRVFLLGEKLNPYPYIAKSSLVLSTSIYEGFALSIIEAVILNKYVVTTKSYSGLEKILDPDLGTIVASYDPEEIAAVINKNIDKKTNKPGFVEQFEPSKIANDYLKFIRY